MTVIYQQLYLFPETTEEKMTREMSDLKKTLDKTRKSQFAKISKIQKDCDELKHELYQLKSAMCHNQQIIIQQPQFKEFQ